MLEIVINLNDPTTLAALTHLFYVGLVVAFVPVVMGFLILLAAWYDDGKGVK